MGDDSAGVLFVGKRQAGVYTKLATDRTFPANSSLGTSRSDQPVKQADVQDIREVEENLWSHKEGRPKSGSLSEKEHPERKKAQTTIKKQ